MAEEEEEEQLFQGGGGVAMLERGGDGLGAFDDGLDSAAPDIFGDMPDDLDDPTVALGALVRDDHPPDWVLAPADTCQSKSYRHVLKRG